jgi:hypothetical protein
MQYSVNSIFLVSANVGAGLRPGAWPQVTLRHKNGLQGRGDQHQPFAIARNHEPVWPTLCLAPSASGRLCFGSQIWDQYPYCFSYWLWDHIRCCFLLVIDEMEETSYKFLDVLQGWKFKFASFAWTGRAYLHYTLYLDHHVTNKKNS